MGAARVTQPSDAGRVQFLTLDASQQMRGVHLPRRIEVALLVLLLQEDSTCYATPG
jgi:hypothetical protein